MFKLSDQEIALLVNEPKPLPSNFRSQIRFRNKRGHKEKDLTIQGSNGSVFRIILRQSLYNQFDFSVILAYLPRESNQVFILRRYNGRSHEHTNSIEDETFFGFHIHIATERYQDIGAKEASYARLCDGYNNIYEAIDYMVKDCNFILPAQTENGQGTLF